MRHLLEKKFSPPAYVLLHEVRNCTGVGRAERYADAIAMSVWPGRGLELHGFELKSSRNDWLRELDNPAKAEAIQQFCDRWWLVAEHDDVVRGDELPPTWGLLVAKGEKLMTKVKAPVLTPKPMDRAFLASLLRNVFKGYVHESQIDSKIKQAADIARANAEHALQSDRRHSETQARNLAEAVATFEAATGVNIHDKWNAGRVGAAVAQILGGWDAKRAASDLRHLGERAMAAAAALDEEVGAQ
jgi:hypothetical protein